jgi:hypothetical protein
MKPPSPDELAAICIALRRRSAAASRRTEIPSHWLTDARARAVSSEPGERDPKEAGAW